MKGTVIKENSERQAATRPWRVEAPCSGFDTESVLQLLENTHADLLPPQPETDSIGLWKVQVILKHRHG